jgi:hypothetical protein
MTQRESNVPSFAAKTKPAYNKAVPYECPAVGGCLSAGAETMAAQHFAATLRQPERCRKPADHADVRQERDRQPDSQRQLRRTRSPTIPSRLDCRYHPFELANRDDFERNDTSKSADMPNLIAACASNMCIISVPFMLMIAVDHQ